jgi:SAM-dependent methyltransferase
VTFTAAGPNAEQIAYWNELAGAKWLAFEPLLDAQISSLGLAVMDRARTSPGQRVLDVGCGCGQTSLQLGERVGATGVVTGIDVSRVMLERARTRVRDAGLGQVRFENGDAQTFSFERASFDLVFSRFGVMFFADPTAAFANLHGALAPGGRLALLCWQGLDRNPWMRVPLAAVARHIALPAPPAPGTPGPFALADAERVRGILEDAGFADVAFESLECEVLIGGGVDLERSVGFALQMGPAGAALREAGEATRLAAAESVREALAPYTTPEGVRMPSASWVVGAGV